MSIDCVVLGEDQQLELSRISQSRIQALGQAKYPETQALMKVPGIGHLTAPTFVLTLGSKERFKQSRDVGLVSRSASTTQSVWRA